MDVIYNNNIKENEFLTPNETQKQPQVKLNYDNNKEYIIIMHDPDAVGGNRIHWMITNIRNNEINSGKIIFPYEGPAPPAKTGKHRYIFELYKQQKNNNLVLEDRIISMNSLRNKFTLDKPIFKIKFISKNEIGGTKKKKTQKYIYKKSKKTRRH